jgi:general secretion pathway protein L
MTNGRSTLVVHLLEGGLRLAAGRGQLWRRELGGVRDLPIRLRGNGQAKEQVNDLFREVEAFLLEEGLRKPTVLVAVPRQMLIWKTFTVPPVPRENLESLLGFEVEKHLPLKREEMFHRAIPLEETPSGWLILLVALRRDLLAPLEEALTMLGLTLDGVVPDLTGLVHFLRSRGIRGGEGWLLLVDQGEEATEAALLSEDLPHWYRRLAVPSPGPGEVREDESQSERLHRRTAARTGVLEQLLQEAAGAAGADAAIPRAILVSQVPGGEMVRERCKSTQGIKEWKVLSGADWGGEGRPGAAGAPGFPATMGLVMGQEEILRSPLNLRRGETPVAVTRGGYRLTAALVLLLLGAAILRFGSLYDQRRRALETLEMESATKREQVSAVLRLSEEVKRGVNSLNAMETAISGRTLVVDVLAELTTSIPDSAYLTQLVIRRGGAVELTGLATAASELIPKLEASPGFRNVAFDAPITSQGQKERFKIKLALERKE